MDFIHRPVSQDKKTKNYRQKIKTWTDQKANVHKQITQGTNHKPQNIENQSFRGSISMFVFENWSFHSDERLDDKSLGLYTV